MYGYIYKTTNLINSKIYVGQKKSKTFKGHLYLGSGKYLKRAINKYGKENFKVDLLEEIETKELMDEREIYWIDYYRATDENIGYNISNGGNVNRSMSGIHNPMYGKPRSEELKLYLSKTNKGKKYSKEFKEKCKLRMINKHWYNNGAVEKYFDDTSVPDGFILGRLPGQKRKPLTEETKNKLRVARLNQTFTSETFKKISDANKGRVRYHRGDIEIMIPVGGEIPSGFVRGCSDKHRNNMKKITKKEGNN